MVTTAPSAFERAAQRAFDALFGHRFDEFKTQLAEGTDLEGHDLRWVSKYGFEFMRLRDIDFSLLQGQKFHNLLMCAIDKGDVEVASFLLANGADANTDSYDDFERFPALYYIFQHPELPNAKEMWTLLRAHGADIDDKLNDGRETTFRARLQLEAAENPVLRAVIGDDFCALG
jgi:ankyrin repeat protein